MMLDEKAKRLIMERNSQPDMQSMRRGGPIMRRGDHTDCGFGDSNLGKTNPADAQQAAALLQPMQTNRQARAVLGVVAQYLQQGYTAAQGVPSFISPIDGTKMAAAAMRTSLDQDNRYAQRVYAGLPDDDAPISDLNRRKVTVAVTNALGTTRLVSTDSADLNRGLTGALVDMFQQGLQHLVTDAAHDPLKALKWVGIGVAVLIGLGLVGKLVHTIMLGEGGGSLGDAEAAAVAIMDARLKRGRRS
jgi:hypothetical protein